MRCARTALVSVGLLLATASAAFAATAFDGTYSGASALKPGSVSKHCPAGFKLTVKVADGAFEWSLLGTVARVKLSANGSFDEQDGEFSLTGKVAAGKLKATQESDQCAYAWSLTR